MILGAKAPTTVTGSPRLDLRENQRSAVERDQVDLAATGPYVACDDHEPESPEVADGEILAQRAKLTARVARGWSPWLRAYGWHPLTVRQKMCRKSHKYAVLRINVCAAVTGDILAWAPRWSLLT